MTKVAAFLLFSLAAVALSVLMCRGWTLYYLSAPAEAEYQRVYEDKIGAGHHPVTAEIDAGTSSFMIWWFGVVFLFVGIAIGGPAWAYQQLWPNGGHVASVPARLRSRP